MSESSFNLIDEKWIPVVPDGRASLKDIFSDFSLATLGGDPRQKIALLKLFQAIAQAANTPTNAEEWAALGAEGLARSCLAYLEKWHDRFFLYGERPFLQMPVSEAKALSIASLEPQIASGNNQRLTHIQCERELDDGEKALVLLTQSSMCLGGKRADKSVSLAKNYVKKATAPYGPGLGYLGLLHSIITGNSIMETIWLNLLTQDIIEQMGAFPAGLGTPPWEEMPETETCPIAERLRNSLQGRLIPLARFCLLDGDMAHYTDGVPHKNNQDGVWDPSAAAQPDGKGYKILWADPEKRPWRSLSALLAFLYVDSKNSYNCAQLKTALSRMNLAGPDTFGIWCGGVKVSANSGEQRVTGNNDYVESEARLSRNDIDNEAWFARFAKEMERLEKLEKALYACVMRYYREQKSDGKGEAARATGFFWEKAETQFQRLIDACGEGENLPEIRGIFSGLMRECYDYVCPQESPKQLSVWAANRPRTKIFLTRETGDGQQ